MKLLFKYITFLILCLIFWAVIVGIIWILMYHLGVLPSFILLMIIGLTTCIYYLFKKD
jgi:hypothetical protein